MPDNTLAPPPRATRVIAVVRLVYTELQYWLLGLTPEGYHSAQASAWEDFGDFNRAAKHLSAYLQKSDSPHVRGLLAYCYSRTQRWPDAAREYAAVIATWPHPSLVLGLAEAKLRLGEVAEAHELVASVERGPTPLEPMVEQALVFLKTQFAAHQRHSK